jgi:hypothetical protein
LALQNASTLNTIKLRGSPMDSSIIAAASAIFGSIVGGLTTSQRRCSSSVTLRREIAAKGRSEPGSSGTPAGAARF